jgi:hypothetical protein
VLVERSGYAQKPGRALTCYGFPKTSPCVCIFSLFLLLQKKVAKLGEGALVIHKQGSQQASAQEEGSDADRHMEETQQQQEQVENHNQLVRLPSKDCCFFFLESMCWVSVSFAAFCCAK